MSADTFTLMAFDVAGWPGPERWCSYVDDGLHYVGGGSHRTRSLARAEARRIAEARRGPGGPAREVVRNNWGRRATVTEINRREAARRMGAALLVLQDDDADTEPREAAAAEAWAAMDGCQREQLKQLLFQGPVWDGNVVSKGDRSSLIRWGFATRCCFLGEQGYTAATYLGWTVHDCTADKGRTFDRKLGCPG